MPASVFFPKWFDNYVNILLVQGFYPTLALFHKFSYFVGWLHQWFTTNFKTSGIPSQTVGISLVLLSCLFYGAEVPFREPLWFGVSELHVRSVACFDLLTASAPELVDKGRNTFFCHVLFCLATARDPSNSFPPQKLM